MHPPAQLRSEPVRLKVVEVNLLIRIFRDPKTMQALCGVRRQIVEAATQSLEEAKRNQIDGFVELDVGVHRLMLQASALTIEWLRDLLFFQLNDDEQT